MTRSGKQQLMLKVVMLTIAALLCPLTGVADNTVATRIHPGTPLVLNPVTGALQFDLGGSETRKLQLQLSQPLMLESGYFVLSPAAGSNLLGLDAVLRVPLGNGSSLQAGAEQILGKSQFQTLGSIQCMNGTLGPDSYTASGCHFVTEATPIFDSHALNLGASHEFGHLSTSVNWFATESKTGTAGVYNVNQLSPSALAGHGLLAAPLGGGVSHPVLSNAYLASEATGIDLNFQLGFATNQAGEIRLGLALTRVLAASYQGISGHSLSPQDWHVASPFDSATLGIEWSRGSFSSGITGYYREPVNFLDRQSLDSSSTFDVHFTWRTPWNANLSIGASNVLGSGVDERNNIDKTTDRYESIYGRIPYVRYQQDL